MPSRPPASLIDASYHRRPGLQSCGHANCTCSDIIPVDVWSLLPASRSCPFSPTVICDCDPPQATVCTFVRAPSHSLSAPSASNTAQRRVNLQYLERYPKPPTPTQAALRAHLVAAMAGQTNGRAKKPNKNTPNGKLNGHLNGHADKSNTAAPATRSSPTGRKAKKTWTGSLTSVVGRYVACSQQPTTKVLTDYRLLSWYLIITFLFRCPSSLVQLSETSPKVCKPYLHIRDFAAPHLEPYYQTYIAPQVEKVRPYVNTLDQRLYTPVSAFTKEQYATYGAHRVQQAQKYAEAEWARTARPQIQNVQNKAYAQYEQYLGPHVRTASDAASPYLQQTKVSLTEIYHLSILPAYEAVLPYARQGYVQGHRVTTRVVFPAVQSGRDATWKFVSRTLWPYVRVLYGDNVEPQLVRIRERLGRYKDQQKVESVVEAVDSS